MKANQIRSARRRRNSGSSIADFGPALIVLLIFIFFPLIDMISLGVAYGMVMVLNYNQVHEASLLLWSDAADPNGTVMKGIPDQWAAGMGMFCKRSNTPQTVILYRAGETGADKVTDKIVSVQTTVICNPWLQIPLPVVQVPGLNGPMPFTVTGERPMENPDYAKP